jgi:hypothetical protein
MISLGLTIVLQFAPGAPRYVAAIACVITGALGVWWIYKHYFEGTHTRRRRWRFVSAVTGVLILTAGGLVWTWPPSPLVLSLYNIYPESWGGREGGRPLNLEAASPLSASVGNVYRLDPCVMPPVSVSNIWIAITFPTELQLIKRPKIWQQFSEEGKLRYSARFGNLDPNPDDCTVVDEPLQFRPSVPGRFIFKYRITGRTTTDDHQLSDRARRFEIEVKP